MKLDARGRECGLCDVCHRAIAFAVRKGLTADYLLAHRCGHGQLCAVVGGAPVCHACAERETLMTADAFGKMLRRVLA